MSYVPIEIDKLRTGDIGYVNGDLKPELEHRVCVVNHLTKKNVLVFMSARKGSDIHYDFSWGEIQILYETWKPAGHASSWIEILDWLYVKTD